MIYKRGLLLVDILLAIALSTLFIAVITESSFSARNIFDRAKERNSLLDSFEVGEGNLITHKYGNDMIETDTTISSERQSIQFSTIKTKDLNDINDSAGTPFCSVDFMGDNNSTSISITPIVLPINPLLPLTDLEVRNGIVYISSDSNTASDPDLFIVDINNTANASIISSINTGPGIASIALAGPRIYGAATSAAGQLHIIRFDGLTNPILEKKYKLPPPYATATQPLASSILYNMSRIYLGTEKWDGNELSVIDVSNPLQPTVISSFETASKVNDIFIRDNTLYLAASDEKQFLSIDISNITNPIEASSFSPSGWQRQVGKAISLFEDNISLGRTSGGFNIINDHDLFTETNSLDIPGGVYGIVSDRNHVYVASRQVNKEFQILNRDLSTSTAIFYPLPVAPQTITCDGNKLFILAATAPVIYEILF